MRGPTRLQHALGTAWECLRGGILVFLGLGFLKAFLVWPTLSWGELVAICAVLPLGLAVVYELVWLFLNGGDLTK